MTKKNKIRIIFNLIGIIIIILIVHFLIQKDLVLDGKLEINSDLTQKQALISVLYPEHRVTKEENYYLVNQEPIYFNVRSPIKFDTAEVEVEFQPSSQKIIGLGVATTEEEGWSFDSHTLYNETLNDINWPTIEDDLYTLYQKNNDFSSLNEFLQIHNTLEGVSAYDFDLGETFKIKNYQAQDEIQTISNCLRGQHKFYTYLKDEALDFTFQIQDINRTDGEDPLIINVYNPKNKKIYSKMISDDGYISKTDPASSARYISIYLPQLAEGVYKIELLADDDVFIRQIQTKQTKIVFIDRLYLCDSPEYEDGFIDLNYQPTRVQTNGRILSFYTAHQAGLQTVILDNTPVNIYRRHQWFESKSQPQLSELYIPRNDLKISSRGIFALSPEQYFNPEIIDLKDYSDSDEVNYIIARYQKPNPTNNNWLTNRVVFDLHNAKIENGNLQFMISSPDLIPNQNQFSINSLKIKLSTKEKINPTDARQEFWQKIKNKINYLLQKI